MQASPTHPINIEWPTVDNSRVPFSVFTDPELYDLEQKLIFRGPNWCFVAMELEIPNSGDYKTTWVGDTPVIVSRDAEGKVHCVVNRCAHRGATLLFDGSGNVEDFTCVYHNWRYDLAGNLQSVAFQNGVKKVGGMPADFKVCQHNLTKARVEVFHGLVFATFSEETPALADYLGERMGSHIARIFNRPVKLLGTYSQTLHSNWKLYMENVKDSYHASLLHTFFSTFKLNRLSMEGGVRVDGDGAHHLSWSKRGTDSAVGTDYEKKGELRAVMDDFTLADPTLIRSWLEYEDGITHAIQSIFPTFVLQQIQNSLAVRVLIPKSVDKSELYWIAFGYADDTPEQFDMRMRQSNLIGPAGLVSLEDGIVGNFIQRGIRRETDKNAVLEMGGRVVEDQQSRVSEAAVRGFWQAYRTRMGL
ncbi:Terephthalate 1,2-dioxygenase, terminal oxygenase component subunit alpha 1 [Variovorax sp. PBS-H4]|uniref:aromatic ring-hydroxylating oxygenase subunit alpha n=1 Tax=Variovorax sp. PBS-H4 TaxID=434008 RepID=UPI0013161711|nr:Rieske 2Fe-2S domain-containing protein [Variovorax sp. PBS-H4]VTU36109.1 Terephthalate 1,2-dioxygenase, terminal oxygenase component subunit alpha 1 [Variovorax sp. PBS-H4]